MMDKIDNKMADSRFCKKNIAYFKKIVERCEKELNNPADKIEQLLPKLQELIDNYLGTAEYLYIMDENRQAVVHSNPFGKGLSYKDEIASKANSAKELLVQVVNRKSKELLLDFSNPLFFQGKRYTLRMGIPIIRSNMGRRLFVPIVVFSAAFGWSIYFVAEKNNLIAGTTIVFLMLVVLWSIWAYKNIINSLQPALINLRRTNRGDYRTISEPIYFDEIGQLTFEINKTIIGVKHLVAQNISGMKQVAEATSNQLEATKQLSVASSEIASVAESVAIGSEKQMDKNKSSAANAGEISRAIEEASEDIVQTVGLAAQSHHAAAAGIAAVEKSINQTEEIVSAINVSNKAVEDLQNKSKQVEHIIKVITGIAQQTNLLALNAAIEAARAGEHGKSFVVVAQEVGKLADDSKRSAKEILQVLSEIKEKINEVSGTTTKISSLARDTSEIITGTGAAIKQSMEVVSKVSQQVEKSAAVVAQANIKAKELAMEQNALLAMAEEMAVSFQRVAAGAEQQSSMSDEVANKASVLNATANKLIHYMRHFKF
jgi:methyl-accepting chemotaxis protein